VGLILIGCARLSRSYIQIKNFLNSYRAGAHSNLVTLDVSTLFSADLFENLSVNSLKGAYQKMLPLSNHLFFHWSIPLTQRFLSILVDQNGLLHRVVFLCMLKADVQTKSYADPQKMCYDCNINNTILKKALLTQRCILHQETVHSLSNAFFNKCVM
jgi:hypothetical protein